MIPGTATWKKLMSWPTHRYILTASFMGVAGSSICLAALISRENQILKKDYTVHALELLENNEAAMQVIGPPINFNRPSLTDKSNVFGTLQVDFKLPIQGSKKSGLLHIVADRNTYEQWIIEKLEVKFNDIQDKLFIVYKKKEEAPSD